ncbi:hypothetical protein [Geodermatophilus sp. SYSU D00710]
MDMTMISELFSGTSRTWIAPGERRWAPEGFEDLTHAVREGDSVARCGQQLSLVPDGTLFPLPQVSSAGVCPACAKLAR